MKTRRLGRSDLELSVVGLGTWAMGGPEWAFGWGAQEDDDSIGAIRRAVELGVNWIDTAAVYGLGRAEEAVARALGDLAPSERPLVFTKCGLVWKKKRIRHRLERESIRRELEGSLGRLRVERIDLYQIHWPDSSPDGPGEDIEEGWSALAELRAEGKVRHIGVSNFTVAQLERIETIAPVESLQPPYSVLRRGIEADVLPYCLNRGIGVIVYSPMESGLLTGKMTRERIESLPRDDWRKWSEEFREPKLSRNLEVAETLRRLGDRRGRTAAEMAIAWALSHPAVTGAIVGARRARQLEETVGAAELELSDDEKRKIGAISPTARS